MSKTTITHACGHKQEHQLVGKHSDRDSKAAWLAKQVCTDCWKAEQAKEREEATAKATEQAEAANLPALKGSEKQVKWAVTIRATILAEANGREMNETGKAAFAALQAKDEAKFWIDNRNQNLTGYMVLVAKEAAAQPQAPAQAEVKEEAVEIVEEPAKPASEWIDGYINTNQIQHETDKAYLIKAIGTDWVLWLSKKFCKRGSHGANISASFNASFEYEIFRQGKGKYNRTEKLDSRKINGHEAADMFHVKG